MDADGWYYEESLDTSCAQQTIRVQQDRPGDWYVCHSNCSVSELNDPGRAAEVLEFFTGSFRWLRFERREGSRLDDNAIAIIALYLDGEAPECEAHIGYVERKLAEVIANEEIGLYWGRIRCLMPPGHGRRPIFCLRWDLMVKLDEGIFEDDVSHATASESTAAAPS